MLDSSNVNMEVAEYANALLGLPVCKRDAGFWLSVFVAANNPKELIGDQVDSGPANKEYLCGVTFNFVVNAGSAPAGLGEILVLYIGVVGPLGCLRFSVKDCLYWVNTET